MAKCRSCHADIIFIKSRKGKLIPVNAEQVRFSPVNGGKDRIVKGNGEVVAGEVRNDGEEVGWISHFSTCPNAGEWRKSHERY